MTLARALAVLTCAATWVPPALAAQTSQLDSINWYIASEMQRQQIPGLSVAVLRGDRILLARGYGFANLELRVPASDSTIYQSGSVGKQFTAAAVGMLAQQGRLKIEDRITKWFPEGKGVWDSVTVRHLLTHTSGIPEYTDSLIDLQKDYTEDELVSLAAAQPLDFPPGDTWSYSNTGYAVLGALIRRITGRFYGDVLHQLIFGPLGMHTRVISEADVIPNRGAGYRLVEQQIKNQEWVSPSLNTTADGALYFTVNDLAKWAVALNHRRLPDARVLDPAWTPVRLNDGETVPYGYGWDLKEQRGHRRVGHPGAWQGFETAIHRYPEFDLSVIVLANLNGATPSSIAQGIAGILEPALQPPQLLETRLRGATPPVPIPALLQRVAAGNEADIVTPGLQRFQRPAARLRLSQMLQDVGSWTALGCEPVKQKTRWLDADVARICYARGTGKAGRTVVTVYYADDWRATYFDYESY
ncbi:MAG TPA: serine hydrolase domain-containing protein [Gemmatimonadales bacterium]